jgi:hypothetical protein
VTGAVVPAFRLRALCAALTVKFEAASVTGMEMVWEKLPLTALTERVKLLGGVLNGLLMSIVVVAPAARVLELVDVVTPAGAPETASDKGAPKAPRTEVQDNWAVALCPAERDIDFTEAPSVQVGVTTDKAMGTVCVSPPPVAVRVAV